MRMRIYEITCRLSAHGSCLTMLLLILLVAYWAETLQNYLFTAEVYTPQISL